MMAQPGFVRARVSRCVGVAVVLFGLMLPNVSAHTHGHREAAPPMQTPNGGPTGPRIWLSDTREVRAEHVGASANEQSLARAVASGQATPLAMTKGDFDGDGVEDLVIGYATAGGGAIALHRGNVDAFAPQSEASFQAISRGDFPSPFLTEAQVFRVPVRPDFIAAGDFTGLGHLDLVVASREDNTIYVLPGLAQGKFGAPQAMQLPGKLTALASGRLGTGQAFSNVVLGIARPTGGYSLVVLGGTELGLGVVGTFPLAAPVSNVIFNDFGDAGEDAAFLSGGQVVVLHAATMKLETLALPVSAHSMVVGSFLYDRNSHTQIALLDSNGSLQIVAPNEFDPHVPTDEEIKANRQATRRGFANPALSNHAVAATGWQIVESIPGVTTLGGAQEPVLLRTRISDHGADDVMVLNPATRQLLVVFHPDAAPGATTFAPAQISSRPHWGSAVAAISTRVNIDGRPGVIALHSGQTVPSVMIPLPDPTFFVNRPDDPTPGSVASTCNNVSNADTSTSCSLREAVLKANATAGTDTITLAAGTYTLSIARQAGDNTGAHGGLYINDSVNIVGVGQASTIIQGGTSAAGGVDLVFAVNEDIQTVTNASASFSNLTIQFGHNRGSVAGTDGDGGCMEYDTGSSGSATLTLTNVTIQNCATQDGNGGALVLFNVSSGIAAGGTGTATISNSTFQNNSVAEQGAGSTGSGGGIWVSDLARMSLSNSKVLNNSATQVNGGGRGTAGGLFIFGAGPGEPQVQIHSCTISGNSASGEGGGINSTRALLIDGTAASPTVISGNSAGANGGGTQVGGGLYLDQASPDTATLTKVTVTGNTATGNGGGIAVGNDSGGVGNVTMHFSRIAGNTGASGSNNLDNDHTTVSATANWWGTNTPSGTITNRNTGTTDISTFAKLTNTGSPATIQINSSSTVTADLSKDNSGSAATLAGNLDVLIGLPVTFGNAALGTVPQAQPESLNSSAQATATFNAGGTAGNGSVDATVDQQTVTASVTVVAPLHMVKSFSPTTVAINTSSTLSFAVTNSNTSAVDASFTDTLPAGLVVAATPSVTNTCGGTVTATAGSGSVSFSNASLPIGSCSVTVKVSSAADGTYNNSVTINSTAAGTGAQSTSSATLTVIAAPAITKAFGASSIPLNGTTSLTFTLNNANANTSLAGVAFTDSLPAGLVVGSTPGLTNTCGGTATATAGASSVSLSGASQAAGASCTVGVTVQGTTAGVKNNSVTVSSTNGGTGNTSNASITVVGAPVIIKAFGAASVPLNGSTSLTFTIQNNNTTTSLSGVGFSDTLPSGLVVATPNGLTGSCGGGTITATAGASAIGLSGGAIAASSSCTFAVNVTGTTGGTKSNTTGNVTSTEGGTGGTASANINVIAPPSIAKTFSPTGIALNATTSLTFTITNPAANAVSLTGVAFTDTIPTGLTVANASATVCGGTVTTTAPTSIAITGATIAANSQCQFSVTVTGAASGQYTNTTGAVTSTNGGTGNTATANLTVATPPSIIKTFGAASVALNGTTSLTFNVSNPNASLALTGLAFTDSLPAGLVVASTPSLSNTCGGTATATAGASSVILSAGTRAASGTCSISVNVTGTTSGVKNNSVTITSNEAGTGNTSNASVTVLAPPVIVKAFGAASVPLNGSTSLSFTVQNNNTTTGATGVTFSDTLPAGLFVSTPNGLTGSCGSGTIAATAGGSSVSLSGGTIAASSSCTFSVNVTGTTAGGKNNTTGNVSSTEGGAGGTASASLAVVAPPSITKGFSPTGIAPNATTSLTFAITNPTANTLALTGVAFTDTLPSGLTVASASATVCGGTLTVSAPTSIGLTGATVAANSQCQFSVTVTGATAGQYTNTTGSVTSTNGGTGNTATANLNVAAPPSIANAFGAANVPINGSTSLTIIITNPNSSLSLTGLAFTDSLPSGVIVAATPSLTNSCGGTASATAGSTSVTLSAGTLASNANCTISVNVTGTSAGTKSNSVAVSSTQGAGNNSLATLVVIAPPVIAKSFGAANVPLSGATSLSFTIQNPNTTAALSGVAFTDSFPPGLVVSTPSGLTGTCGAGTVIASAGSGAISLSGGTIAASGSCTFSLNVTGTVAGAKNNTTGNVSSTEGGTGGTASASFTVVGPASLAETFTPTLIAPGGTSTLSFTATNPTANTAALTGVAFTDNLPTGIVVATPNNITGSCGGTVSATAGAGTITLSGGSIAASNSCTFSVTVTSATPGAYTNVTGSITSTNGGTGNTASANLSVGLAPSISKAFGAASINVGGSTSLTFAISNPNSASALSGVAFTDTMPAGLTLANPNGLTGSCGSGTVATTATSVSLSNGTIPANSTCHFSVNVTAVAIGNLVNTTGNVTAANAGAGNAASASIDVVASDLTIALSSTGNFFQGQTGATYTVTVSNAGPGSTTGTVTVTEAAPSGLSITVLSGAGWTCSSSACTRSDALAAAASYPPISVIATVAANAPASVTNGVSVSGGGEVNTANDTATDVVTVTAPPDFTITETQKAQSLVTVTAGQPASYVITVAPENNSFTKPITFSLSGLPSRTSYSFSPSFVTPGAKSATVTLTVITTQADLTLSGNFSRVNRTPVYAFLFPVAGLLLGFANRRVKVGAKNLTLVALFLVCCGFGIAGCASRGNSQNLGTPAGTYSLTITATSGNLQHTSTVTLVVKP
jgi:uncharacterized repeat protein (TIGR01451 family)